jgi:hypothetical protein
LAVLIYQEGFDSYGVLARTLAAKTCILEYWNRLVAFVAEHFHMSDSRNHIGKGAELAASLISLLYE